MRKPVELSVAARGNADDQPPAFQRLLSQSGESSTPAARVDCLRIGTLVGFREIHEPLVTYSGRRSSAAVVARTTVDVSGEYIGHQVTLMFEDGDPDRPIITGRQRGPLAWPTAERPTQVEVDADGKRLMLGASEQLVLKCGKASITLTAAGKILVQGAYISQQSSGVVRVKGGSIRLN